MKQAVDTRGIIGNAKGFNFNDEIDVTTHTTPVVEIPRRSKTIACSGCGRDITVADRVCMAYCASCSADQGKKK